MPLTALELISVTIGLCATIHFITYLVQYNAEIKEDEYTEYREILNQAIKKQFLEDNGLFRDNKCPYFHWEISLNKQMVNKI